MAGDRLVAERRSADHHVADDATLALGDQGQLGDEPVGGANGTDQAGNGWPPEGGLDDEGDRLLIPGPLRADGEVIPEAGRGAEAAFGDPRSGGPRRDLVLVEASQVALASFMTWRRPPLDGSTASWSTVKPRRLITPPEALFSGS